MKILLFFVFLFRLSALTYAGDCKEFIELNSAETVAKELGVSVDYVLSSYRINLWSKSTSLGDKGRAVGKMIPGSRAEIIKWSDKDVLVKSPLDQSTGWVDLIQIKRTIWQDTQTFKECRIK